MNTAITKFNLLLSHPLAAARYLGRVGCERDQRMARCAIGDVADLMEQMVLEGGFVLVAERHPD